jgi:hypothetical protein
MSIDVGDALIGALRGHTLWWERRTEDFSRPLRQKSDCYHSDRIEHVNTVSTDGEPSFPTYSSMRQATSIKYTLTDGRLN